MMLYAEMQSSPVSLRLLDLQNLSLSHKGPSPEKNMDSSLTRVK